MSYTHVMLNRGTNMECGGEGYSCGAGTVPASGSGIASAWLITGQSTAANSTYWYYPSTDTTRPNPEQVGENLVDAQLPSGTGIATPFAAYGFPKAARTMQLLHGDGLASSMLFLSGFASVIMQDEYGNPISNLPVTFEALAPDYGATSLRCNPQPDVTKLAYFIPTSEPCLTTAPVWGACGLVSRQTLTFYTQSQGAMAEIMLGGVPYAVYPFKATCTDAQKCTDPATNQLLSMDFKQYTYDYNCGTELHMQTLYPTDAYGNNINAGKTGTQIPVMAKMYYLLNSSASTSFDTASVTFSGQTGTAEAQGVFRGSHTLTTGLNWVNAQGSATINGAPYAASISIPVYGVNITLTPPTLISLDSFGYAKTDTVIPFTITPAEYTAMTAYMVILKNGEAVEYIPVEKQGQGYATIGRGFWFDINSTYSIQVRLNIGTGVEISSDIQTLKLVMFDIIKPADSANVLIKNNSNGDPKMQTLNAQVVLKGSGVDPGQLDLTTKQICWQFKVEYNVNITKSGAEYRSRDGLDCNDQRVCDGIDGYFIPALDPNTNIPGYKCRTGVSFTIDDTGNNGAKWDDSNFGGGKLSIIAKIDIDGVPVSDTFTSVIQGQTFLDDADAADLEDPNFEDTVKRYLETVMSDAKYQDILPLLGHPKFLRIIAYKEAGVVAPHYSHFAQLKSTFWESLADVLGYPSSAAVYPIVNTDCEQIDLPNGTKKCDTSQPFFSDGGYGLMQLTKGKYLPITVTGYTEKLASYEQIWNWKKNIDGGIMIVKEKLEMATAWHNKHPVEDNEKTEFLRWDIYQLYQGGHFWKWVYDKDAQVELWEGTKKKAPYGWDAIELEEKIANGKTPEDF